ncbi:DeoR/GlpR family DNA-binding transcription regulator [Paenibacillus hamazuiensis]|uniref:DeoR/GlpR family DNA-binding transcription regulator n=1 Tax=Paenibacillus hamazuiensis TaxID=2936508 RepID=UPI00200C3651|nr:DeoR/GlpR family DNA-binding transcription regulator [Paenibacillus hamazuiensis]
MIPEKRHNAILELLKEKKTISIAEIVKELNISEITARRDLEHIESSTNLILRIRGGAKLIENQLEANTTYLNDRFSKQLAKNREEKQAIGRLAASLVQDDETIIIDAGSTGLHVAKHMDGKKGVTAIVTAVNIAEELEEKDGITTVITGGVFRSRTTTLLNPFIEQSLMNVYADKVFIGVTGVSITHGFSGHDFLEADVKKILMKSGREIYWLADASKLNYIGSIQFAPLDESHTIITDWTVDPEIKRQFEQKCRILVAERG